MKTSRVSRIIQIITALQSAQHYAVCDLAKMFGTSRRTIFRDLKELETIGVPYHFDSRCGGYIIDPEFFLPPPDLSAKEALGLLLSVHKTRSHIHLPLGKRALWAALKIENNLTRRVKQFCSSALKHITISGNARSVAKSLDRIFLQLIEATLKKRIVSIRYNLPVEHRNVAFDLQPYHLLYNKHTWHVLGKSSVDRGFRAFKLNRIEDLHVLDKCFSDNEEFDIRKCLGRAWSMLPEGRLHHVKLRFLPEVAHDVAEVQWHSTQAVSFDDDGSAIIEFRVDGLREITWWVLGYGDRVQVLAPAILRRKIIDIAQNMVKRNSQLLPVS